jgi:hypothetical protein
MNGCSSRPAKDSHQGERIVSDRCYEPRDPPAKVGWYGVIEGDGEGRVWLGTAYWNGIAWQRDMQSAVVRSVCSFPTENDAFDWAHEQPD